MYLYKNHSSEFIIEPTKYSKYYFLIIERALSEQRTKLKKTDSSYVYYENHHILPASLFPEFKNLKDNTWNSVLLTAREHFLVHALIYKHFKSLNHHWMYKMGMAFNRMRSGTRQFRYSSKFYEYCKINIKRSPEQIQKVKEFHTGRKRTVTTRSKMSNAQLISSVHRKQVCVNFIIYDSIKEAGVHNNVTRGTIYSWIKNKKLGCYEIN